jgi:hypothetical protein
VKKYIDSEVFDIAGEHVAPQYTAEELPVQKDVVEIAMEN